MALLKYFKCPNSLPTVNETEISDAATREANAAVSRVLASDESGRAQSGSSRPCKRNCTNLFQPLDLSVNKPLKDKLRRGFSEWYTQEVAKKLSDGVNPDAIHIYMRMSTI